MTISHMKWALELRAIGQNIGREGMARRVIAAVEEFDGSFKDAMILAGRLKAIAQMAKADGYWSEKVDKGFHDERERAAAEEVAATTLKADLKFKRLLREFA